MSVWPVSDAFSLCGGRRAIPAAKTRCSGSIGTAAGRRARTVLSIGVGGREREGSNSPPSPTVTSSNSDPATTYAYRDEYDDDEVSVSIESIAAALESGRRQSVQVAQPGPASKGNGPQRPPQTRDTNGNGSSTPQTVDGRENSQDGASGVGPKDDGVNRKQSGPPNRESLRKRRARKETEVSLARQHQNAVAIQLKADSPAGTLVEFDLALAAGVQLPSNVLCGILNQFAKAGWMDDCMRVCQEMKVRGLVIAENTFVPLVRGLVAQGDCRGALDLIKDMVKQGLRPRLRCYEPVIARMCEEGDMDGATEAWEHMEQQGVNPLGDQFISFLCGLTLSGGLWERARSGKLAELLSSMSYRARNVTLQQAEELESAVNLMSLPLQEVGSGGGVADSETRQPLARRVKVPNSNEGDMEDDWSRRWSDAVTKRPTACPACGGLLMAVGLTPKERARIRDTLFDLAGLQVKKHARSKWRRTLQKKQATRKEPPVYNVSNESFHFTEEDQKEQLQIFVDWLHQQRANGKTFTAVIDSANVAYHRGNPWHFSLPQVDLMVQALEAKGERPLVVIAEKYIDRVDDTYERSTPWKTRFRYMRNPLNQAIIKRWRSKSQVFECSDEASDDWYWMYAAVAFDDIPMTVISNDRTRDHRMSLAEPVPFIRWRTTQLARFDLSFGIVNAAREGVEVNAHGWPLRPPSVAIQAPPGFTRDIQRTKEGSWHLPAGAEDDWLCIDVPRGLRLGLDRLPPPLPPPGLQRRHAPAESGAPKNEADVAAPNDEADVAAGGPEVFSIEREGRKFGVSDERPDSKIREVGGLLQSMQVRKYRAAVDRQMTPDTVEAAAAAARAAAAAQAEEATMLRSRSAARTKRESSVSGIGGSGCDDVALGSVAPTALTPAETQDGSGGGDGDTITRAEVDGGSTGRSVSPGGVADRAVVLSSMAVVPKTRVDGETAHPEGLEKGLPPPAVNGHEGHRSQDGTGIFSSAIAEEQLSTPSKAVNVHLPVDGVGSVKAGLEVGAESSDTIRSHWGSMTVVALKLELRSRGLKVSGNKADLVERLAEAGRCHNNLQ